MKHCVVPAALAALLLLAASAHATAVEDSLAAMSDSARVALIFPFEVGQVYQFKASGDFTRPNGEVLPAYTVAEVTITDTVINDVTWFRIPYWSPFGTELYRLDESHRVMAWYSYTDWEGEGLVLDMSVGEWLASGGQCVNHFPYTYSGSDGLSSCGPKHQPIASCGWLLAPVDSACRVALHIGVVQNLPLEVAPAVWRRWGVHAWHGARGSATCVQGTGHAYESDANGDGISEWSYEPLATWALFRPKTDEAWPTLDPMGTTDVKQQDEPGGDRPPQMTLRAYPNPFNSSVTLAYAVSSDGDVQIDVYNIAGQRVRTLLREHVAAGSYAASWDGLDASGRGAGSGVYFIRLTAATETALVRATLLR